MEDLQFFALQIALLVVLLALNGFFVAVEFAMVSVPRPRIDQLAARGSTSARLVQHLLTDPDRVLAASQLGITMASLALGFLGDSLAEGFVAPLVASLPLPVGETITHTFGFVVAFALITSLHIVLGEQAPKMAAIRFADRAALFSARPIRLFALVFRPFIALLDNMTAGVLRLFGIESTAAHKIIYTSDELKQIVTESQHAGEIAPVERELVHNVFDFGDRLAHEVMIPRTDMDAIQNTATLEEFSRLFAQSSRQRYPVYAEDLDQITGYVSIKDVLYELTKNPQARQQPIAKLARPALFVPESKRVGDLLAEMQKTNRQLCIVVDEYGGTAGMITARSLLEEIVGPIGDERVAAPEPIRQLDEYETEVDAQLRVDEANELLGTRLPESDDYDTVAGLVLTTLGRIPEPGEVINVDQVRLQVVEMNGPRIEKILVRRNPSGGSEQVASNK